MNIQMILTSGLSSESQNWMFMVVLLIIEFQIILFLSREKKNMKPDAIGFMRPSEYDQNSKSLFN